MRGGSGGGNRPEPHFCRIVGVAPAGRGCGWALVLVVTHKSGGPFATWQIVESDSIATSREGKAPAEPRSKVRVRSRHLSITNGFCFAVKNATFVVRGSAGASPSRRAERLMESEFFASIVCWCRQLSLKRLPQETWQSPFLARAPRCACREFLAVPAGGAAPR